MKDWVTEMFESKEYKEEMQKFYQWLDQLRAAQKVVANAGQIG